MLKPSQNKKTALSSQHQLRREKELACAYDSLTAHDIEHLLKFCYQSNDIQSSHLLLASLYTARSIKNLLNPEVRLEEVVTKCGEYGILYSLMEHPKSFTNANNSQPFIFLPTPLLISISNAQYRDTEYTESRLKEYIATINRKYFTRLTLGKIRRYLVKEASNFDLSQAEVSFIANFRIREHAGSSYLSITAKELAEKHSQYINYIQRFAQQAQFKLDSVLKSPYAEKVMGSNRSISDKEIIELFTEMKQAVNMSLKQLPGAIWQLYNDYTLFTVCLLFMSTGHRPVRNPFATLSNFDLVREVVWIKDKQAREDANRLLPLGETSSLQLKHYLTFLIEVKDIVKYSYPAEAESIRRSVSASENLFKLKDKSGMTFYSISTQRECCTTAHQHSKNWYRHWIRQLLAKHSNINLSAIDAFMAHENLLDESFSLFSNLDVAELRKITEAIERKFAQLGIDALKVTL